MTMDIIADKIKHGMVQEKTFPAEIKSIRDRYAKLNKNVLGLMKKYNFSEHDL